MKSITVQELKKSMEDSEKYTLLDLRENRELITASIDGAIHIPMMAIPYELDKINKDEPVYILCHSGVRSAQACLYLEQKGFDAVNIRGGIHAWSTEIDPSVPIY
jgi:rhodanese-related sulfurtransferase